MRLLVQRVQWFCRLCIIDDPLGLVCRLYLIIISSPTFHLSFLSLSLFSLSHSSCRFKRIKFHLVEIICILCLGKRFSLTFSLGYSNGATINAAICTSRPTPRRRLMVDCQNCNAAVPTVHAHAFSTCTQRATHAVARILMPLLYVQNVWIKKTTKDE